MDINVNKDVFMHHERVLNVIFDGSSVERNVHTLQQKTADKPLKEAF